MKKTAITTAVAAVLIAGGWEARVAKAYGPQALPAYIAAALADPVRGDVKDTDARRKPGAIIAFAGIKPGDKVVDLIPGSGYFTKIFVKVVGPSGHVFDIWPNEYAKVAHPDPENSLSLAAQPGVVNLSVVQQPAAAFKTPEPVDVVFTAQNYHDYPDPFMGRIDPVSFDRAVYAALKPGGIFLVIDHAADAGSGMRDTDMLHRIDPATVRAQVVSAGFVFDGQSDVLRNPADDHQRRVFDKTIRGHTDQFVYKFHKPI